MTMMEQARQFAIAYLSSIEGRLDPENHTTQHFVAAMAAARREGAEQRTLDEAVIEAARQLVEAHDNIRTDTAARLSALREALAARGLT